MKEYPISLQLTDIWKYFEDFPMAHFATIEGDQPRVRMMALIAHKDTLWLTTKNEWDKIHQIRKNRKVELTVPAYADKGVGCIRITGFAEEITESKTREDVAAAVPWFSQYWSGPDDENFILLRLDPSRILFDHPTDKLKYTVQL
jgi:uncharacterized pyridoxamine 5'-phosphate oxidase family protein